MQKPDYMIAIETGGSHCRGVLYETRTETVMDSLSLDQSGNVTSARDSALEGINTIIATFAATRALDVATLKKQSGLTLCLAGAEHRENVQWLKDNLKWPTTPAVVSDVMAGFFGTSSILRDGSGLLIGGTGNIAVGYSEKDGFIRVGGRADARDKCSGDWIGRQALLSESLRDNPEFKAACRKIALRNNLDTLDTNAPTFAVAQLAPQVFDLAEKLPAARAIIDAAAEGSTDFLRQLNAHGVTGAVVVGGVAQRLIPEMTERLLNDGIRMNLFKAADYDIPYGALNVAKALADEPRLFQIMAKMTPVDAPRRAQNNVTGNKPKPQ
jgi:N-acetylglucosamine kinase-like BadF-type ATPase